MDLVDEEHRARLQVGQERRDVGLALERRPGGLDEAHAELLGDDPRQRGLAQPGRAGQQHVVERLVARRRGADRDRELVLERLLADEVLQPAGAQPRLEVVLRALLRGLHTVERDHPRRADRLAHRRAAPLSAWAIRSSGVSPGAPSSSPSASWTEKPSPTSPSRASVRGSSPRWTLIGAASSGTPTFSRSSTTIRSAVRRPIPGTASSRAVSPAATPPSRSRGGPPESTA